MREKSGSFNPLFEAKSLLLLPQKMPHVYLLGDLRLRNVHSHTQTHTHTGFPNAKKCFVECYIYVQHLELHQNNIFKLGGHSLII